MPCSGSKLPALWLLNVAASLVVGDFSSRQCAELWLGTSAWRVPFCEGVSVVTTHVPSAAQEMRSPPGCSPPCCACGGTVRLSGAVQQDSPVLHLQTGERKHWVDEREQPDQRRCCRHSAPGLGHAWDSATGPLHCSAGRLLCAVQPGPLAKGCPKRCSPGDVHSRECGCHHSGLVRSMPPRHALHRP